MTAKGHATGSVEACAGVSALMCTLAGVLSELTDRGEAETDVLRLEGGDAEVSFRDKGSGAALAAFETVVKGLSMLGDRYGEFVQVTGNKR